MADAFQETAKILTRQSLQAQTAQSLILSNILGLLLEKGIVSREDVKSEVIDASRQTFADHIANDSEDDTARYGLLQLNALSQQLGFGPINVPENAFPNDDETN